MSAVGRSGGKEALPVVVPEVEWGKVAVVVAALAATAFAVFMQVPVAVAVCGAFAFSCVVLLDFRGKKDEVDEKIWALVPTIMRLVGEQVVLEMLGHPADGPIGTSSPAKGAAPPPIDVPAVEAGPELHRKRFQELLIQTSLTPMQLTLVLLEKIKEKK